MKLKILIIAENNELLEDIQAGLKGQTDISVVGIVPDAFHAVNKSKTLKPDMALVDIEIPLLLGCDVAGMIRNISPEIKTVYIGTFEKNVYKNLFRSPVGDDYIQNSNLKNEIHKILRNAGRMDKKNENTNIPYEEGNDRG